MGFICATLSDLAKPVVRPQKKQLCVRFCITSNYVVRRLRRSRVCSPLEIPHSSIVQLQYLIWRFMVGVLDYDYARTQTHAHARTHKRTHAHTHTVDCVVGCLINCKSSSMPATLITRMHTKNDDHIKHIGSKTQ